MTRDAVRSYIDDHRADLLADLDQWLRIPGISAQPERHADVRRSAEWFADAARRTGFPHVEILDDGAWLPAVYAEWPSGDAGAPTVLVYAHHDVQPVDPLELWHTDPFVPTVDGDVLRARGASDDKGQLLFHLLGLRAHLAATGRAAPAVNLKFIVEGEEESGSPHFEELLDKHRDRLGCDVVVVTDTGMIAPDVPSTVTGMRGMVACSVSFHGPDLDLHSGVFGGAVPNPATGIARMVAALHDGTGRVQVPGFYDDVRELSDAERELFAKVPVDDAGFLEVAQSRALYGEAGYSTLERVGARPTAEVNGLGGGYQGDGHKTIVPSDAFAKLSFRLVADQDPAKIIKGVERFVAEHTPDGVIARIDWEGAGVRACEVPIDTPAYRALAVAISAAFDGVPVLPTREGGSGPEAGLQQAVGAPLVFLGVGLPDDQIHAPNEKVTVPMLFKGAEAAARLWAGLAELGRDGLRSRMTRARLLAAGIACVALTVRLHGCRARHRPQRADCGPERCAHRRHTGSSTTAPAPGSSSASPTRRPPARTSSTPPRNCRSTASPPGSPPSTTEHVWPVSERKVVEPATDWVLEEGAGHWGSPEGSSLADIAGNVRQQMVDLGGYGANPRMSDGRGPRDDRRRRARAPAADHVHAQPGVGEAERDGCAEGAALDRRRRGRQRGRVALVHVGARSREVALAEGAADDRVDPGRLTGREGHP